MNEKHIGKICPYCKTELLETDNIVECSNCEMPHHMECWVENQGCTTFGCTGTIQLAQKVDGDTNFEIDVEGATGNEAPAPKFCSACGEKLEAASRFCGKCGKPLATSVNPAATVNPAAPFNNPNAVVMNNTITNASQAYHNAVPSEQDEANDAQTNKWMAALSYLGILLIVPYLKKRNSPFVKFHLNQGALCFAILLVSCLAGWLIPYIGSFISGVGTLAYVILGIMGIVNCVNCEKKQLPVIGKYEMIK